MSTTTANNANNPQATPEQVNSLVKTTLGAADAGNVQTLQNARLIHEARLSQLKRTAATLKKAKAPEAEITAAEAAVSAGTARVAHIAAAQQQAATPTPEVSANGWALYGRVYDDQAKPVASLTVFLVDSQKAYQANYGFSYTDSTGYFLINNTGAADAPDGEAGLFIAIVDQHGLPIYLSPTEFQPVTGEATYQDITVPTSAQPLGDPPEAIRGIAFPNSQRKS